MCWFEHSKFLQFVKEEWSSFCVTGTATFIFTKKLQLLKERLRWWNSNVFGVLNLNVEKEVDILNEIEKIMADDQNSITEAVSLLVKRACQVGSLDAFKINDDDEFSLLQYADDTILIGQGSWSNLWAMKAIIMGFEMISGLLVGGNQRRIAFWNPVIECVKARLSSWKGRLLSIGGRVSFINSVLTNLPIHYFSFLQNSKESRTNSGGATETFLMGRFKN
ncbi:unnamed protein product [Lathyrus sativus]|nr:unnamed protein product [Lathyrus sativus]